MSDPKNKVPAIPVEKDAGYGASHGYGPGRGGPSGPGDAPAKEPAVKATPLPVEADDYDA
jgi:hypothetical protein